MRIKHLEDEYFQSGSQETREEILLLKAQYNEKSATKAASSLLRLKHFMNKVENLEKCLCGASTKQQNERLITSILK